jgi:O-antigen ligase
MALTAVLLFGILTLWAPGRWALSAFQIGVLSLAAWRVVVRMRSGGATVEPAAKPLGEHPVSYLLAAVVLWGVLQLALGSSVDRAFTEESVLNWLVDLAAFAVALDLFSRTTERERFLNTALWFTLALAVTAVFTLLTSPPGRAFWIFETGSGVPTLGPFVYRNQYAAFIEAILPLAVLRALSGHGRTSGAPGAGGLNSATTWIVNTAIVAVLFGSVVAAGSRAGAILCVAEIVAIPMVAKFRGLIGGRAAVGAIAGSLAAMAILAVIVGWQPIWARLQEPNPYSVRLDLLKSSIAMVRDRPWTGSGLGTWSTAYPAYALFDDGNFVNQAHNDWIQWAVEGGLPLFLMLLGVALWSIRPALRTIWGIGMLAVFLHCLVDYPMQQRPALATFFFAMLGALAGTRGSLKARKATDS